MGKNILICDDAAFMRMMIKDILSKNGYNVVGEAENGAIAVEKYKEALRTGPLPRCWYPGYSENRWSGKPADPRCNPYPGSCR